MDKLFFRNSRLIVPDGAVDLGSISLGDGVVLAFDAAFNDAERADLKNLTVMPGFIDVHNHGAVGVDVNEADADGLMKIAAFLAANGVTAWMPTLVPDTDEIYERAIGAIDELMERQRGEPVAQAVGVHYEGVFASEKMCGALRPEYFRDARAAAGVGLSERTTPTAQSGGHPSFVRRGALELPRLKRGVHMTTLAPEIDGGIELVGALAAEGWVVSIGHTQADAATLDQAYKAGARHMTHFFNAMTGVHHRDLGVAGWGLAKEGVTFDIIPDGVHVHPKMIAMACRAKTPDKVTLISDSVAPTGLGDGEFELWGETITVKDSKTQNERGSIAGSVSTMLDGVRMMRSLGFSDTDIAKMASANPAKLLGLVDRGSIEIGKRADLVGIDAEGNIAFTMIGGRIVENRVDG